MAEESPPPLRLMNFVSEEQLDQAKKTRGERADDGTAQRDKPLFEILKENKDKRDAEFNERFKHRPPKALDEDETEFLEKLEMSRKEYERQLADEEAQQLRSFQAAVAAQSSIVHELKETTPAPKVEEAKPLARKNPPSRRLGGFIIKVQRHAKKVKTDEASSEKPSDIIKTSNGDTDKADEVSSEKPSDVIKASKDDTDKSPKVDSSGLGGLVSYSDESEEDDE